MRFSELPITRWHDLSLAEKRSLGIAKGAGVSVIRSRREIAYGWHFCGRKRRENYDDWWRCEISFPPELDEYFGVTHSKQGINPRPELEQILTPDIESIVHTLNARARQAFAKVRFGGNDVAARVASARDRQLKPVLRLISSTSDGEANMLWAARKAATNGIRYHLKAESIRGATLLAWAIDGDDLTVTVNRDHPFYRQIYQPLDRKTVRIRLDCLFLALARAEVEATNNAQKYWYRRFRVAFSNALVAFLGA